MFLRSPESVLSFDYFSAGGVVNDSRRGRRSSRILRLPPWSGLCLPRGAGSDRQARSVLPEKHHRGTNGGPRGLRRQAHPDRRFPPELNHRPQLGQAGPADLRTGREAHPGVDPDRQDLVPCRPSRGVRSISSLWPSLLSNHFPNPPTLPL